MPKYDFLIVGAGFFGATCARLLTDKGYKCLIIEKEKQVGGLSATHTENDIDIHLYGPHIFHTDNDEVWNFVNKYGEFNNYKHTILCLYKNEIYNYPVNMNTFSKLYNNVHFPKEALRNVSTEIKSYNLEEAINFEEKCVGIMGFTAYAKLIKGYTEKLWGTEAKNLDLNILNNIAVNYTYDNSYFIEKYQGVPKEGYTKLIEHIIGDDIDIMLNKDFLSDRDKYMSLAKYIIFTGPVDAFCKYVYGPLKWRTNKYEIRDESASGANMLGAPVVNITDSSNEMLQMIEHKWFTPERTSDEFMSHTFVSYVYPEIWNPDKKPMYAVNNSTTNSLFNQYANFVKTNFNNIIISGRLGMYQNISMAEAIEYAMRLCSKL